MSLFNVLLNKKQTVVYLKLYADRMELVMGTQVITEYPQQTYSSVRLLVHDIEMAVDCLQRAIDKCNLGKRPYIKLIIQAQEKVESGLCDTEVRILEWLGKQAKCAVIEIDTPMACV